MLKPARLPPRRMPARQDVNEGCAEPKAEAQPVLCRPDALPRHQGVQAPLGRHASRQADVRAVPRDHRTQPACPGFPNPPTPRDSHRPGPFPACRHRRRPIADAVGSSTSPCGRCLADPMPRHGKTGPCSAAHGQCSRIEFPHRVPAPKPIETTPCQCSGQHRPAVPFRHLRAPPAPLAEQHFKDTALAGMEGTMLKLGAIDHREGCGPQGVDRGARSRRRKRGPARAQTLYRDNQGFQCSVGKPCEPSTRRSRRLCG